MERPTPRTLAFFGVLLAVVVGSGTPGDATTEFQAARSWGPMSCPAGWTLDEVRAQCYKCPAGTNRTVLPFDAAACEKPGTVSYSKARKQRRATAEPLFPLLKTRCPAGQFLHAFDGFCYRCPDGAIRTGTPIDDRAACALPVLPKFSPAQWRNACPAGAFRDLGRGDCWSCPANWHRTAAPVNSETACTDNIAGMLGVNPRAVCGDLLKAVAGGQAGLDKVRGVVETVLSPVLTPVGEGVRQLTDKLQSPAEVNRLIGDLARPLRPYRALVEDLPRLASQLEKAAGRLQQLLLNPSLMCDGDFALLNREITSLGLWPNARTGSNLWRDVPRAQLALGLAPRNWALPGFGAPSVQTSPWFVSVAGSMNIIWPPLPPLIFTLSAVTDGQQHAGAFLSMGFVAATAPMFTAAAEFSVNLLVFPASDFEDFSDLGSFSTALDFGANDATTQAVKTLWNALTAVPLPPGVAGPVRPAAYPSWAVPAGVSFSADLVDLVTLGQSFGIGVNWDGPLLGQQRAKSKWPTGLFDLTGSYDASILLIGR